MARRRLDKCHIQARRWLPDSASFGLATGSAPIAQRHGLEVLRSVCVSVVSSSAAGACLSRSASACETEHNQRAGVLRMIFALRSWEARSSQAEPVRSSDTLARRWIGGHFVAASVVGGSTKPAYPGPFALWANGTRICPLNVTPLFVWREAATGSTSYVPHSTASAAVAAMPYQMNVGSTRIMRKLALLVPDCECVAHGAMRAAACSPSLEDFVFAATRE